MEFFDVTIDIDFKFELQVSASAFTSADKVSFAETKIGFPHWIMPVAFEHRSMVMVGFETHVMHAGVVSRVHEEDKALTKRDVLGCCTRRGLTQNDQSSPNAKFGWST